jgi:hypothetical protein
MKIKQVPNTSYNIEIIEPCCKPGKDFLESGVIEITDDNKLVYIKRLAHYYDIKNCMYCGARIEVEKMI